MDNTTFKLNAQPFRGNTASFFFNRAVKVKLGRDAGTTRPQETTWDQAGPNTTYKIEDSHVFSQSLFATIAVTYKDFGFTLTPQGSGQMRQDSAQVFHNTYFSTVFIRPQSQANGNLSYFFRTGALGHQLKLGGRYLRGTAQDSNLFEGNVVACNATAGVGANWCGPQSVPAAELNRDLIVSSYLYHYTGYVSDTITTARLTVNLGLRYDDQHGVNAALSVPASGAASLVPAGTVLPPALDLPASDPGFRWKDWQPRVGATYSLDSAKKTLARASYARYSNQMGSGSITPYSPAPATSLSGGAGVVYAWRDANNDNHVDPGELDTSRILRSYGFDPTNPTTLTPINGVDPGFGAVKTDEITLGLDHAFLPTLAVSVLGTYRRMSNFELATGFGLSQTDYILSTTSYRENGLSTNRLCPQVGYTCGTLPDGARYDVPVYRVNPSVTASLSPGQYTRNNPGYHQTYYGLELQALKRYADNWMARLSVSYNDWTQHYGENGFVDPTNVEISDGGLAIVQSIGSGDKTRVYINGTWQVSLSALYTLPRGFSIAGNFFARQGYPLAYFQNVTANPSTGVSYDRVKSVVVAPYDSYRLGTVSSLDLGLSKSFKVRALEMKLLVDVFNVMNHNTVLQRQSQVGVFGPNGTSSIREVQSPRALRLGARLSF